MANNSTGEKRASDLSATRRWLLVILVSMGSSTIYAPAYIKAAFYDAQMEALQITNAQMGELTAAFGWTALACYLFSGLIADRVRMRTLSSVGFITTAILTFWYAMLPSYSTLILIFIGMGVTTILIWWGVRYKLVRLVCSEEDYARNIGISYAFYGVAGVLIGVIGTWVLAANADDTAAFRVFLIILALMILALGILSILFIPKFEGELSAGGSAAEIVTDTVRALANPVVVITAVCVFFVYFFYTSTYYTATYMGFLGADDTVTNLVSVVRTYGVTLLAGPTFGALAHRAKRPSIVIFIGAAVAAVGFAITALLPNSTGAIAGVATLAVALGFVSNGVFSIVSGQLTEGRVPLAVFGAATGVLSVIGFAPDTFSGIWLGSIIDKAAAAGHEQTAYPQIMWILAGFAIAAVISAAVLYLYVNANRAKLDAKFEATSVESASVNA